MAQLKDSLITGDLRVTGTIYGKATNAVLADEATAVRDKGNGTLTYLNYSASGMSTTSWVGSWDGYTLKTISPTNLKTTMALNNVENTKLSTWTGSSNITTIGTLSSGTVPWARLSGVPSASTSAAGIIQIGTGASNAAAGNHTHPIKTITGTMPTSTSSPWTINVTNKTVQISDSKITAKSVLQWGLASTATQAQYEAFAEAEFIDSTTAAGSATIKALGTMPTVAIPVVIHILGETE